MVLEGCKQQETPAGGYTLEDAVALAKELMEKGMKATDSAKEASEITGLKKNDIYRNMIK